MQRYYFSVQSICIEKINLMKSDFFLEIRVFQLFPEEVDMPAF